MELRHDISGGTALLLLSPDHASATYLAWAANHGHDRVLDRFVLGEINDTALTRDVEITTAAGWFQIA
jgi:hypothetical protein